MTRDRAARLALVLILVTGLLVSRRLDPRRRGARSWPSLPPSGDAPRQVVPNDTGSTRIVAILGKFFLSFFCHERIKR